jgi:two-component system, OmpR family, response regulator BaeR
MNTSPTALAGAPDASSLAPTRVDATDTIGPMASKVLVVEDEAKIASVVVDYLALAGYASRVVDNGLAVVDVVREWQPDLVLLDLMLPGRDGLTVCRHLRAFTQVPVIMVTARVEEIDRLLGLELGADDYVCKPFSPRELVARVKAVLRRARNDAQATLRLHVDANRFSATLDGKSLDLTPVEFRLLHTLAAQPGRIFTRAQLLDRLYEDHRVVSDRTVDSHVKNLRRKLQDAAGDDDLVRSVYGVGYKLEL